MTDEIERNLGEQPIARIMAETYALDEVREAMRAKWESRTVGGIVLHPSTRSEPV